MKITYTEAGLKELDRFMEEQELKLQSVIRNRKYVFGDSWSETNFVGTFTDLAAATSFPHFAATVDVANSRNLLIAWNAIDAANADLRCYYVTESALILKTDVVTDSTDDQSHAALALDTSTGYLYAFYCGKSDGSETVPTSLNVYYKRSTDAGVTWGAETVVTSTARPIKWLATTPCFTGDIVVAFVVDESNAKDLRMNVRVPGVGTDRVLHPIEAGA